MSTVTINNTTRTVTIQSAGTRGVSSFVYIAYAEDDTGTGFSTEPGPGLDFIAILVTNTAIAGPEAGDFAGLWTRFRPGSATTVAEIYDIAAEKYLRSDATGAAITPHALTIEDGLVEIDLAESQNFTLTAGDDYALSLPVNCFVGMTYEIEIENTADVTAGFASGYVGSDNMLPAIVQGNGETMTLACKVMAVSAGTATLVRVAEVGRNWGDGA